MSKDPSRNSFMTYFIDLLQFSFTMCCALEGILRKNGYVKLAVTLLKTCQFKLRVYFNIGKHSANPRWDMVLDNIEYLSSKVKDIVEIGIFGGGQGLSGDRNFWGKL